MFNCLLKPSTETATSIESQIRDTQVDDDSIGNVAATFDIEVAKSRIQKWSSPIMIFFFVLSIDTIVFVNNSSGRRNVWSGVFKPITLFYLSNKARDALEALNLVAPVVFKIVIWNYFLF